MKRRDFATGFAAAAFAPCAMTAAPSAGTTAAIWARREPKIGRNDALLIQRDGRTLFEAYGGDHGAATRHNSWSMAKSVTQALAGIAVRQGRVTLDDEIAHPGLSDGPPIRLRHLLTMTSGLRWRESDGGDATASDASRLLYGPGRMDVARYTASKPREHAPGTVWAYSTGSTHLACWHLQSRLFPQATTPPSRRAAMAGWIRRELFMPLGMTTTVAEFDPSGTFYGGSLVYATAREFAAFGRLYLDDGITGGRRILPEGWVRFARTPTVQPAYGAGWWLEAAKPASGPDLSLMGGEGPSDAFAAEGHEGQLTVVVPSRRLVLVRLGYMPEVEGAWAALGAWTAALIDSAPYGSRSASPP